jgi:hypothetical protein
MSGKRALSHRVTETEKQAQPVNGSKPDSRKRGPKRVTFLLPEELDTLLEIFCGGTSQQKNEVARTAITQYLSDHRKDLQNALDASHDAMGRLIPPSRAGRQS